MQSAVEKCGWVAELAERFPETNENIQRGAAVDMANTDAVLGKAEPKDADARACMAVAREVLSDGTWDLRAQEKVQLHDPETGALLTEGTPDVQALAHDEVVTIDWKKREQWLNGYLAAPDDNLQLHTYSIARCLATGAKRYRNVLVVFGDGQAEALLSRWFEASDWWPLIERIRVIQAKERIPAPGAHCQTCWHRWLCENYRERAQLATAMLHGIREIGPLTDEQAGELALRALAVKAAAEVALDLVKAHAKNGGVVRSNGKVYLPTQMPGRRTADVNALERDGLGDYVRKGDPYERWTWRASKEERR